jgi:hypothetical protein
MLRTAARRALLLASLALGCATRGGDSAPARFAIHVVDEQGRPVPCLRLTTPQKIELETDQNGVAAFWEPGLMGRDVFFTPEGEGWQHAPDASGMRGQALRVTPGGSGALRVESAGAAPACQASDAETRRAAAPVPGREQLFRIDLIDSSTGRGVPLMELRTPEGASYWSDNQGVVAFDDLGSMGRMIRFEVRGDGYRTLDPSGAARLVPTPGERAQIALERLDVAERLYRVTGAGLYRDSIRLGLAVPIRHPLVNAGVAGQDSVQALVYQGRIFWLWGDTPWLSHPLGNFHTSGATSLLPDQGGLDPALGVDLDYFVGPEGNARAMTDIPGPGATWLTALVNVPDARGEETLFALYGKHVKVDPPEEHGIARFDAERQVFLRERVLGNEAAQPHGSALRVRGRDGDFVHYADDLRTPARAESLADPGSWQSFTPFLAPGRKAERGPTGEARYAWRTGGPGVSDTDLRAKRLAPADVLTGQVRDIQSGKPVAVHATSTFADPFRGRFVRVFTELDGAPSRLGEIWYLEGDTPMGPWYLARKIVSHQSYSFYNPFLHPHFAQRGGRTLFFEGTYTVAFAKSATPTPRYDYNQIMHRLDLEDPRLRLPVPIYDLGKAGRAERYADKRALRPGDGDPPIAFFALDQPAPGTVPVWWSGPACGKRRLVAGGAPATAPLFWAYTYQGRPSRVRSKPLLENLAYVLESPVRVRLPVSVYLEETSADAGTDQCLREPRPGEAAAVVLDAGGTRGPGTDAARYAWSWPGGSASGRRAEVSLPAGLYDVRLEVTTPDGVSARDAAVIEVAPPGGLR